MLSAVTQCSSTPVAKSRQILGPLLRGTANGDEKAFAELYKLTSGKLFNICVSILRDKADADDALQDVYIVIWCKAALYDETKSSPMTWLARLARNRTIDRFRMPKHLLPDDYETNCKLDEDPDALSLLITRQEQQRLISCLGELDAPTQRAIRGAFFSEVTHSDLASAECVPLGTMKSRVRRGLRTLGERFEMLSEAVAEPS